MFYKVWVSHVIYIELFYFKSCKHGKPGKIKQFSTLNRDGLCNDFISYMYIDKLSVHYNYIKLN